MLKSIVLWQFPEEDFQAWCELVATPEVASYREYMTLMAAMQADQERQGYRVERAKCSVAEMKRRLAAAGLGNTSDNRARIAAEFWMESNK